MSYIGGTFRIAFLLGPLIGGVLVDLFGFTPTFLICGLTCLLGVPAGGARRRGEPLRRSSSEPAIPLFSALWQHRSVVLRGGVALAAVGTVRHGRYVAVPLIADELGLTPSATGGIIAIGTAADLLLFPVAGHVMDSFGRLRAIVPSFVLVAVGLVVLGTAESATMVALAGAVIGVGNGFGAGSNLTIATDLAPPDAPGQVLSAVATIQDLGTLLGPLIVGVTADHFGLSTATMTLAFVAIFAVVWLIAVVGETRGLHPQVRDAAGA